MKGAFLSRRPTVTGKVRTDGQLIQEEIKTEMRDAKRSRKKKVNFKVK